MALMVIAPSWGCLGLNELPFVSCLAFCLCWTGGSSFDYNPGTSGRTGIRSWCCPQSAKPRQASLFTQGVPPLNLQI